MPILTMDELEIEPLAEVEIDANRNYCSHGIENPEKNCAFCEPGAGS